MGVLIRNEKDQRPDLSNQLGREHVDKNETVAQNHFPDGRRDSLAEHRSGVSEGMEFASLAARVNSGRKLSQQRLVKSAACKSSVELFGVNASEKSPQPCPDHLPSERGGVQSPDRKQRSHAAARKLFLAILPDVFEEQIAKDNAPHAFRTRGPSLRPSPARNRYSDKATAGEP